jgi:hypothetical protein
VESGEHTEYTLLEKWKDLFAAAGCVKFERKPISVFPEFFERPISSAETY